MCVANWIHLKFIWNSFEIHLMEEEGGRGGRRRREEKKGGREGGRKKEWHRLEPAQGNYWKIDDYPLNVSRVALLTSETRMCERPPGALPSIEFLMTQTILILFAYSYSFGYRFTYQSTIPDMQLHRYEFKHERFFSSYFSFFLQETCLSCELFWWKTQRS